MVHFLNVIFQLRVFLQELREQEKFFNKHYLAPFNSRTKRYCKVFDMIFNSIFLFFNRKGSETMFI